MVGRTLSHYRILEKIGAGGMGVVYRAHDERLERDVALKVLPAVALANEAARKRFRKEALALSRLNHPNIAAVYDFDTEEGVDFLVMEFVPGVTLDRMLADGPLPQSDVTRLALQLTEGLAAAHQQGVVHRDLKPGNLRVTPEGRLKILDFGLATMLRPSIGNVPTASLTEALGAVGTLPYMAPEQLRGDPVDARSDIYSVGVVLYEMVTRQRPFRENVAARLTDAILHQPPVPPRALKASVPANLERVILRCLEKEPRKRYQSIRDVGVDLLRPEAPPSEPVERVAGRLRPPGWVLVGLVLAGLLALAVGLNVGDLKERLLGRGPVAPITSLAVLPLANQSGDPEQEYFADGMTEELITDLAKIGALRVISRTSVMRFKGSSKSLPDIARELHVGAVVEGSVMRSGERVRITAQLVEGAADRHLWAESYERDLTDILALQGQVARAIAEQIKVKLTPQEATRLASARPVNPEAHEAYLRGRYHWNSRTEEGLKKSIDFYNQAIERAPDYAPAHAGLADSYIIRGNFGLLRPEDAYPRAKAAAMRALELDDSLAEAHTSLAFANYLFERDWTAAERGFKRAIELNPNYGVAHQWYGVSLASREQPEAAIAELKRAQEVDPLSLIIQAVVGWVYVLAHRYDQAIEQCRRTLEIDANFAPAHLYLGQALEQQRKYKEAIAEFEKATTLFGKAWDSSLGHAYTVAGRKRDARKVLDEMMRRSEKEYVPPDAIALIYAGLGETDRAFAWLNRAENERQPWLVLLKVDPRFDALRSDPRFQDLVRHTSLARD